MKYKQYVICDFLQVKVSIPRRKINKLFYDHKRLSEEDARVFRLKSHEIEKALYKLQHVATALDKILLRSP